jgi:hypothetical protein
MEEPNSNPGTEQNADHSNPAGSTENIYQENVRSNTKGKYTANDIVRHLAPLASHCDTPLMKATYSAIMDDFKTKAKIDESGKGMKFLEKLHEIAIEVKMAEAALEDLSEDGITYKLKKAKKTRETLFELDGVASPPELHTPDYLTPVERLGRIQFIVKTYTSDDFYKLITQITDDLYSGDDVKLTQLRNKHSKDSAISSLKIKEFEERANMRSKWEQIVDDDTRLIEGSKHYKMVLVEAHSKQCLSDIKALS